MKRSLPLVSGALAGVLGLLAVALAWFTWPVPSPDPHAGHAASGTWVVWSPGYRVSFFGIERLHPIDTYRSDKIAEHLVRQGLITRDDFVIPAPATDAALARVHGQDYLTSLHQTPELAAALEVPVPDVFPDGVLERRVRHAFRLAAAGTVLAAHHAVEDGFAINLGGGFHHARPDMGHGFCIVSPPPSSRA